MIKRNRYLIFLIKETLARVINYKYFIKLNIIAIFNKLRIYLNSEEYIYFFIINSFNACNLRL